MSDKDRSSQLDEILRKRKELDDLIDSHFKRPITILFTDIVGSTSFFSTRGDIEGRLMIQRHNDLLIPLISEHGGKLIEVIGDALLASFEEPSKAVACGARMQEVLAKDNEGRPEKDRIEVRIGAHLGEGFVEGGRVYGVVVHIAERIKSLAGGSEIFISESVYRSLQPGKDPPCVFLDNVQVKGKEEEIKLYRVIWKPEEAARERGLREVKVEDPLYRRTFVGREQELRQLQGVFDVAFSGQGSLAMVVGEPGIGKTALCEQLATYATVRGGQALVGHCYEEGSFSLPYLAFVEALRSYVLAREPDDLRRDLGSGAAEVARIVSEVRERLRIEPSPSGDPEDDRWRLLQAVTAFLRNASSVHPILLVLEDLHWADRGTLDLLVHLARNLGGSRLLVVGTYRDIEVDRAHPLSAALAELRRVGDLRRVLLRGLTADEVHRMVKSILGQEVRWGFSEAIHRQTEGNPLFVQEVIRYVVEEKLVTREEGHWRRTGETPPEMSIPEGLRDVIGKRLSRLSPECNRLLNIAAVVGRDFYLETLQRVADVGEEQLLKALEEAIHVGVLEEQAKVGVIRYRFAHAFFRQTLYEETIAPRRLRLHQQVARVLEAQYANRLDEHAAELAEHFANSTDPADLKKAVHYSELAARRAMSVYAYGEAVRLLEQALEVQEVLDPQQKVRRCDLLLLLGKVLMASGEPQRVAEVVMPEVLALAEELGDRTRASAACRVALTALERYGGASIYRTEEYRRWAEHADRQAPPGTIDRVCADVALQNSLQITGLGTRSERERYAANALELARQLGSPQALLLTAMPILGPTAVLGEDERYRVAREVAACERQGVDPFTLARGLYFSSVTLLRHGDRDAAETLWREIEELGTRTRDTFVLLRGPFIAAVRATLDGCFEDALAAAKNLRERAEELGSAAFGRQWGTQLTMRPLIYLGRAEDFMRDISSLPGQEMLMVQTRSLLGLAYNGRVLECRHAIEARLGKETAGADALIMALEAAVVIADVNLVTRLASQLAGAAFAQFLGSPEQSCASVGRVLGGAAALAGKLDEAEDYCRQAIAACERARFRPELALTRLQLAEVLLGKSKEADGQQGKALRTEALQHLDFAIGEFQAMKMEPALKRALQHKSLLTA